jgi:hypothetical protein
MLAACSEAGATLRREGAAAFSSARSRCVPATCTTHTRGRTMFRQRAVRTPSNPRAGPLVPPSGPSSATASEFVRCCRRRDAAPGCANHLAPLPAGDGGPEGEPSVSRPHHGCGLSREVTTKSVRSVQHCEQSAFCCGAPVRTGFRPHSPTVSGCLPECSKSYRHRRSGASAKAA